MLVIGAFGQAQPKVHEMCKKICMFSDIFFSSFSTDCGLYIKTIQHEIAVLRRKESIRFVISFYYTNNLIFSIQIVFPSLNRFDSWQNWERKRVNYNNGIFRKKPNSGKTWFKSQIPRDIQVLSDLAVAIGSSGYSLKKFEFYFPQNLQTCLKFW